MSRRAVLAGMTAVGVGATLVLAPAMAEAGQKITKQSFGMHSFAQAPFTGQGDKPLGSLRMNMWPNWRQLNPAQGTYNWPVMDGTIAQAKSWGYQDLLYVFGNTPQWAGKNPVPDPSRELETGNTAPPAKMKYFKNFATKMVKKYGDDIDSWQVWNEITSPQFWQGSAQQMAKMTQILNKVVNKYDKSANVVSGSVQTHRMDYYSKIAPQYFKALKSKGWPVDVAAGHFYPAMYGGPDKRIAQIKMFQRDLQAAKMPKRVDMWDTEANFWTTVGAWKGNPPMGRVTGKKAATWVARNYLDTWRTGLKRSYWYMWTEGSQDLAFPGIQMRTDTPWSRVAYTNMYDWTVGSKYKGYTTKGNLVTCNFSKGGKSFMIAFTNGGKATVKFSGTKSVTPVFQGGTVTAKGSTKVGKLPVRIG